MYIIYNILYINYVMYFYCTFAQVKLLASTTVSKKDRTSNFFYFREVISYFNTGLYNAT